MEIIGLGVGLVTALSLITAILFPVDREGKSFSGAVRGGGLSLAGILVVVLIAERIAADSPEITGLIQLLYAFLLCPSEAAGAAGRTRQINYVLSFCLFWLLFILCLVIKYGWAHRKRRGPRDEPGK